MQGTVAVTDQSWYEFLAVRHLPEVNFWTPSARRRLLRDRFSPFFFKLKSPHNAIAGFGYYASWSALPAWLAWESFGEGNGAPSLDQMLNRILAIRQRIRYVADGPDDSIGCVVIVQPTFFDPSEWVPQPRNWPARTVGSMGFDLGEGEGKRIWEQCLAIAASRRAPSELSVVAEPAARYGTPVLIAPRLGQGAFRVMVTDAYGRACAVTGEHSLPVLDAAHIRSFVESGPHEVSNGLLLRADLHRLFDKGYVTVTPDLRFEVSGRLRKEYRNGRTYYPLHGASVSAPRAARDRPATEHLRWHNEKVFLR
jgi:putative restriction endonuclease